MSIDNLFDQYLKPRNDGGTDIPGPVDWEQASHWCVSDPVLFTVETWCKMGPDYQYKLRTRVRPMVESEVILAKLEGHGCQQILKCFGIDEDEERRFRIEAHKNLIKTKQQRVKMAKLTWVNIVLSALGLIMLYINLSRGLF